VNKFIYGIKLPFSDLRLPGLREPERGDIAVFTVAQRARRRSQPTSVRASARGVREADHRLPGDRIAFRSGGSS